MKKLGSFTFSKRRWVLIGAAVFFVAAALYGGNVATYLAPYGAKDPDTESIQTDDDLEAAGFRSATVVVLARDLDPTEPNGQRRLESLQAKIESDPAVESSVGWLQTRSADFVSRAGDATYLAVTMKSTDDGQLQDDAKHLATMLEDEPGVEVGGSALSQEQVNAQIEEDLRRAELLVFPLLFLLSLIFFRSLIASALPLIIGAIAIVGTWLLLRAVNEAVPISVFALNLTIGLGLGLAIDYSLFIVSRYREEIEKLGAGKEALVRTLQTAGRTVLFSSITVAAALASLIVFPQRFLYSMVIGGSLVALFAALISLLVLPAILAALGERVNSLAPKFLQRRAAREASTNTEGFWYRLAKWEMLRPVLIAGGCTVLLLVLASPALKIKFGDIDAQVLPQSASARQVDDFIRAEFPPYRDTPVRVLVSGSNPNAYAQVAGEVARLPDVMAISPPRPIGSAGTLIEAISKYPSTDDRSADLVREIRDLPEPPGAEVRVTGASARFVDFQASLVSHLPVAAAIIIVSTLLVLFLMTGSVVLPLKQLLLNILNLAAVFGILVWIFQDGNLQGLLDFESQGNIEQTIPILLFAVSFGLSTDYGVFLFSRIKEARDEGATDGDAVAIGLERTGRIITSAALLFAIAIGAFAISQIIFIKLNGVGGALSVLIDATIIRALLVPSLMALLGQWNWWSPRWLRRIHWRFGISEEAK